MKILIVFNHPAPYKVKLFNELTKYADIDVIFERNKAKNRETEFYGNQNYKFNVVDVKLHNFGDENVFGFGLTNYLKKNYTKYDSIIMNGYSTVSEMSAINFLVKNNIKFTLMINGGIIHQDKKLKKKIKTHYISSAASYLCPNEESIQYLLHYGADQSKIKLYPYSNIFETDIRNKPVSEEVRKQILLKYHLPIGPLFINPNQFIPRKNNEQLLEIFKNRTENLLLIGNGPLRNKYQEFIKVNKCENIKIINFLNQAQLREVMQVSTCLITLSKEDIFGHTILEALSNGIPVISSDKVISALNSIRNDVNGYIVSLDKYDQINDAIEKVNNLKFDDIVSSIENHTIEESAKKIIESLQQ